jgi:uncharacterized protein (DUF2147 family)
MDVVHMGCFMPYTKLAWAVVIGLFAGPSTVAAQQRLAGVWLTADKSSHVLFLACGADDCGQITWFKDPIDPETGKPWRDKFNPDDAQKRRPLLGLVMITSLKPSSEDRWDGELYNPLDGKTYTGRFQIVGADRLQLKGCVLAGLICQTEMWTRVVP